MYVGGLVMDPSTQAPIVVLKDESGQIALPIWIGMAEATSIASAIKQVPMVRPLTHDLMYNLLNELGVSLQRVMITELKDSTYYSELILAQGERIFIQDARPSDAIALALRASAPIFVAEKVLEQARVAMQEGQNPISSEGVEVPAEGQTGEGSSEVPEVAESLDEALARDMNSIDKDKWEEILEQLDPEDFKYKM